MKAARFHGPGEELAIEDVPKPAVEPGSVLVRVGGCGICHSDMHIRDGDLPLSTTPLILGHETAGYVEAVGEGVTAVDVGDPVAVFAGWGCGTCDQCIAGNDQLCNILRWCGIGADGGFAEYLRVPSERYLVGLETLDPADAAPLTDAALTSYRAVEAATESVSPDGVIGLIGIGGLGRFGVQFAAMSRAADVVAIDTRATARDRAESLGADDVVAGDRPDTARRIRDVSDGGVDAVVDFVGTDGTLQTGMDVLRDRGSLVVAGIGGGSVPFGWNPLYPAECTLTTVNYGSLPEFRTVVQLAEDGDLTWEIERITFEEVNETLGRLERGELDVRAVLTP